MARHGRFCGLNFGPGSSLGFVWSPRNFRGGGLIFFPFDNPCHLNCGVPAPPAPHWALNTGLLPHKRHVVWRVLWVLRVLGEGLNQSARIVFIRAFSGRYTMLTNPKKGHSAVYSYHPALFLVLSVSRWCLAELIFTKYDQHCSIVLAEFKYVYLSFLLIRSL